MPIGEEQDAAADDSMRALRSAGLRVEALREGSLGSRIRTARRARASVLVVIGNREAEEGLVQATDGADGSRHVLAVGDLADQMASAHRGRAPLRW